eukprot:Hpha_TRINITY_DN15313_c3_g14::TRINITY_DN15313_c3_g14_i1::g.90233::m.90233
MSAPPGGGRGAPAFPSPPQPAPPQPVVGGRGAAAPPRPAVAPPQPLPLPTLLPPGGIPGTTVQPGSGRGQPVGSAPAATPPPKPAKPPAKSGRGRVNFLAGTGAEEAAKKGGKSDVKKEGQGHSVPDLQQESLQQSLRVKKPSGSPLGLMWSNTYCALQGVKAGSVAEKSGANCLLRFRLVGVFIGKRGKKSEKDTRTEVKGSQEALKALASPECRAAEEVTLVFEPCPELPIGKPDKGEFEPCAEYQGWREGMYFGTSAKGTGYHKDPRPLSVRLKRFKAAQKLQELRQREKEEKERREAVEKERLERAEKARIEREAKEQEKLEKKKKDEEEEKVEKEKERQRYLRGRSRSPRKTKEEEEEAKKRREKEEKEEEERKKKEEEEKKKGKEVTVYREMMDQAMGFRFLEDLTLFSVSKGSPAEEAGLGELKGWRLISLEGKRVRTLADCMPFVNAGVLTMYLEPDEEVVTLDETDLLTIAKKPTRAIDRGFTPAESFQGKRKGFYFAREEHGLGYYRDDKWDAQKDYIREQKMRKAEIERRVLVLQKEIANHKALGGSIVRMDDGLSQEHHTTDERRKMQEYEDCLAEYQELVSITKTVTKRAQCLPTPPGFREQGKDRVHGTKVTIKRRDPEERVGWDFSEKLVLMGVRKNSPAEKAGLDGYLNWTLSMLNGKPVYGWADLAGHEETLEFVLMMEPKTYGGVKQFRQAEELAVDALEKMKERDGEVLSMSAILMPATGKDAYGNWMTTVKVKEDVLKGETPQQRWYPEEERGSSAERDENSRSRSRSRKRRWDTPSRSRSRDRDDGTGAAKRKREEDRADDEKRQKSEEKKDKKDKKDKKAKKEEKKAKKEEKKAKKEEKKAKMEDTTPPDVE